MVHYGTENRKKRKVARIRYEDGKTVTDGNKPYEGFVLEKWDDELNEYVFVLKASCQKCAKLPDAEETDFIHWSILAEIAKLSEQGYTISM